MKKTTLTIEIEHYNDDEAHKAMAEVFNRITEGYVEGHYYGYNDLEVKFKLEETEA